MSFRPRFPLLYLKRSVMDMKEFYFLIFLYTMNDAWKYEEDHIIKEASDII